MQGSSLVILILYPESGLCTACKDQTSDVHGDHSTGCKNEGERIYRHNTLRDTVHATAKGAGIPVAKEERSLLPGTEEKPADVYLPGWANGLDAALDITVVSPLQSQLVKKAAEEPGSAARKRYKEKQSKYLQPCKNEGIEFLPVVVETLGGFHPDSELVI